MGQKFRQGSVGQFFCSTSIDGRSLNDIQLVAGLGWAGSSQMSSLTCLAPESLGPIPLHGFSGVSLGRSVISQSRWGIQEQVLQEIGGESLEPEPGVWHSITSASFYMSSSYKPPRFKGRRHRPHFSMGRGIQELVAIINLPQPSSLQQNTVNTATIFLLDYCNAFLTGPLAPRLHLSSHYLQWIQSNLLIVHITSHHSPD